MWEKVSSRGVILTMVPDRCFICDATQRSLTHCRSDWFMPTRTDRASSPSISAHIPDFYVIRLYLSLLALDNIIVSPHLCFGTCLMPRKEQLYSH